MGRTSCTKKKSSPASTLLTAFGPDNSLSLHEPIGLSTENGILNGWSSSRFTLPAQLAPIWNAYGLGGFVAADRARVVCPRSDATLFVVDLRAISRWKAELYADIRVGIRISSERGQVERNTFRE